MKEADPKSFESMQGNYGRDRRHVYFDGGSIQGADPQSFKVLSDTYAKDNARAYFGNDPIAGADPGSFVALNNLNYGRDKNDFYMLGNPVRVCDAASFRFLTDEWQIDSKCAYRGGNKLANAHPESFVALNFWYAKDAQQVYSAVSHRAIEGADAATFKLDEGIDVGARDKNRCYRMGDSEACESADNKHASTN